MPSVIQWTPLAVGLVLLYIALTSTHVPTFTRPFTTLFNGDVSGPILIDRARPGMAMDTLRSQYEQQIRQAARMEERARLARDLHDAIKQHLFAIQTSLPPRRPASIRTPKAPRRRSNRSGHPRGTR
jgi:signal transduction histidine kinase